MTLRQEVSKILGLFIDDYGWEDAFKAADIQGKLTNARTNKILLAICKRLDEQEQPTKSKTPKSA